MKAIYIRTSTEEQNPENQIKDIESIAGKEYILYKEQESAWKNKKRTEFEKLLKEIKQKKIKQLYVWDLDRIYRNRAKLLEFFKICKVYGCNIYSYRQNFLNEIQIIELPKGFEFIKEIMIDNFLQFLGWIAEDESNKKSQRVRAAIRLKEDGAYSYKGNKWGRKRVSTFKKNKIKEILKDNPKTSIRSIAKEVGLSVGVVHKYLPELRVEKEQTGVSSQLDN